MSNWFTILTKDLGRLPDAIDYYNAELDDARPECSLKGNLEKNSREIPGIVEHRFNQLQEVEAILEYLNVELRKLRSKTFRQFIENYNRTMSSRDADKYVDGDENVCDLTHLVNEFALVRNKYLGFIKALDAKQFQLNNITKIRAAGLEDVTLQKKSAKKG